MFTVRQEIDFSQMKGSIRRAHEEAFYWFNVNGGGGLVFPKLKGKQRTSNVRKSLFWFKEDANFWGYENGSVVRRARDLAQVISDAGVEIREISVKNPGRVIWEDTNQILALPENVHIPRAFK
ncbi:MAG: hypothetical protein ABJG88_07100 [Litorimonas sp.]